MILALELAFAAVTAAADQVAGERAEPRTLPHLPVLLTFAVLVTVLATTKALELALTRRRSRAEPAHARTGKQEEAGATPPNGGFE
jgi:predicted anti-sigma-YlaC factor YlaD